MIDKLTPQESGMEIIDVGEEHVRRPELMVTGGMGLVGSAIDCDLRVGSEFDLRDSKVCNDLFFMKRPINVIHCAAKVGGIMGNMNFKGELFYDNIMINTNIIESCRKFGVKKLVVFLSTCVFPDNVDYPLTESKIHLGPPHNSNNAYAYAKRMAEVQVRAYKEQYGLQYTCVVPTNIYGPHDNFDIKNGHVIPSLIHKCYLAKLNKEPFRVWGSGKPLREFIHSRDVANITKWILNNYEGNEPIILSPSEEISIKEVVNMIAEAFEFDGEIVWMDDKPDGQFRKPSDNSKLKSLIPDYKFIPLYDGIKETVSWFLENYENCRK